MTTDQEIWERFKKGDSFAFTIMFEKYLPILYDYGSRLTKNQKELEDLIQELFLYLWRKREGLGEVQSIKGYLLKSLRRKIISDIYSKPLQNVSLENHINELDFHIELSSESKLITLQVSKENELRLKKLIETLPKRQKEAIYLKYYEHLDIQEICTIMDVNKRNVYKLLKSGLKEIRNNFN